MAVLAVVPYLNSLQGEFTFDDVWVIRDNPAITGKSASGAHLFTTVYNPGALYRPLTMLTYLLNARFGGGMLGYHAVNVVLHALVSVAAFYMAWRLLGSRLGATITAVLFAAHPIHTEAVSSIVGRAEVLAALFVVVSLLAFMRALESTRSRRLWLATSVAALALGCLAKESGFVAIPLCVVVYVWRNRILPTGRSLALFCPQLLIGIAYLSWRVWLVGTLILPDRPQLLDNPLAHVPLAPRLETALVILWQYLSLLTVPLRLSADYSYNEVPVAGSVLEPRVLGAIALFTLLAAALALAWRRMPALVLGVTFMIVSLSLTANVLFPIGTIKAERLLYLPSLGWCLGLAAVCVDAPARRRSQLLMLVVVLVSAHAARTWVRNRDWRDESTLFGATVQTSPHSSKAHYNLGIAREDRGDIDAALYHFHEALRIYPPDADAALGLGRVCEKKGKESDALEWYQRATQLNWRLADAHLNAGSIHYKHGDYAAAESAFRAGLESAPRHPRLLVGLALALSGQGSGPEAAAILARVEALPDRTTATDTLVAQARSIMQEKVLR